MTPTKTSTRFTRRDPPGGLLSKVYKIKIDPKGNKWIGSYGGLTKYDGKTAHLPLNDGLGTSAYDMAFDTQGRMWIATWKGVSVFDGKRFMTYTVKDGLADKWVYAIGLDHDGYSGSVPSPACRVSMVKHGKPHPCGRPGGMLDCRRSFRLRSNG